MEMLLGFHDVEKCGYGLLIGKMNTFLLLCIHLAFDDWLIEHYKWLVTCFGNEGTKQCWHNEFDHEYDYE